MGGLALEIPYRTMEQWPLEVASSSPKNEPVECFKAECASRGGRRPLTDFVTEFRELAALRTESASAGLRFPLANVVTGPR